jgi:hypothetical protein
MKVSNIALSSNIHVRTARDRITVGNITGNGLLLIVSLLSLSCTQTFLLVQCSDHSREADIVVSCWYNRLPRPGLIGGANLSDKWPPLWL